MELQGHRLYGTPCLLLSLATVALCLIEFVCHRQSSLFREYAAAFISLQWVSLVSFAVWGGTFLFLSFGRKDLPLIGVLLITLAWYFLSPVERPRLVVLVLVFGVTLGKGVGFAFGHGARKTKSSPFLICMVGLLALAAWWHLDMSDCYYHGPRWMGLWDNPNTYGMLMGAGGVLAIGLLAAKRHKTSSDSSSRSFLRSLRFFAAKENWFLGIAIFMLGVGLVMSYSRGAWLGTAVGLLYLAWCYGKLKWKYVVIGVGLVAIGAGLVWGNTHDSAPWYVKRADLGRPSAQNRAAAWRAGLEIMRDHPLGVGWNNAVKIYGEKYHPPEGGPGALTTNDYMMLGTELGIPALLCFVAYVVLCYRNGPRIHLILNPKMGERDTSPRADQEFVRGTSSGLRPPSPQSGEDHLPIRSADSTAAERERHSPVPSQSSSPDTCHASLRTACLAGALVFVVAFWFDGGLFKLPTAALFWVLLELGAGQTRVGGRLQNA